MNTENIKTAIMKAAESDPEKLSNALDLVLKRTAPNFRVVWAVSWIQNSGISRIGETSFNALVDSIAENADELAVSMPQHLAEVIGYGATMQRNE